MKLKKRGKGQVDVVGPFYLSQNVERKGYLRWETSLRFSIYIFFLFIMIYRNGGPIDLYLFPIF